jgi:ABC-type branched-subunit amino acid transport system ATPase component
MLIVKIFESNRKGIMVQLKERILQIIHMILEKATVSILLVNQLLNLQYSKIGGHLKVSK